MTWNDDDHGIRIISKDIDEVKLYYSDSHTWGMKLSQLKKQKGILRIITYTLPDIENVINIFNKRPYNIFLICHSASKQKASDLKKEFPKIKIATNSKVHSKVVLIEPNTVYISSANFARSGWHETSIGIRSKKIHNSYLENSFIPLWNKSEEIK